MHLIEHATLWGVGATLATAVVLLFIRWSRGRNRARALGCGTVAFLTLAAFPTAAFAASSQSTAWVVSDGYPVCAQAHVYINNTTASPHLDAYGMTEEADYNTPQAGGGWLNCNGQYSYRSPYQLRTREDLYVYVYGHGWEACNYGAFVYNTGTNYKVGTGWNALHPCGDGTYYFASGYGAYYNASWLGGWTQSPQSVCVEYYPQSICH